MADEPAEDQSEGERRYRQRIGITLAVLALLGAWIAILQTNAATNESTTTRQATRLASEAQTAAVVDDGVRSALRQVDAEVELFGDRPVFDIDAAAAAEVGAEVDVAREQQRLDEARSTAESALATDGERADEISVDAARLSLERSAVVDERVTWNARASQYETVMTTLAVAIFLIGFTMVVGRRIRPPFAAPGLALAVFCFGWAVHIYLKPIPDVASRALDRTAVGQVALGQGRGDDAIAAYADAVDADLDYATARSGLGFATLVAANPDLLETFALTDTSPEVLAVAGAELEASLAAGGDDSATTLASAALVAFAAGDWELAGGLLEDAIELNEQTPDAQLLRSAVAVAVGDRDAAVEWLERGQSQGFDLAGTDTARRVTAQYLSALEWVAAEVPERAALASEFRELAIRRIVEARAEDAGSSIVDADPAGATISIVSARYVDGSTEVQLDTSGIGAEVEVAIVGYERPAHGAAWVQPAELFYVGPDLRGDGVSVEGIRECVAVEYRFDLYVDGRFADSATAPGGEPTC